VFRAPCACMVFGWEGCVRQDGFLSLVSMNVVFLLCATVGVEVRWGFLSGHGTGRESPFILMSPTLLDRWDNCHHCAFNSLTAVALHKLVMGL